MLSFIRILGLLVIGALACSVAARPVGDPAVRDAITRQLAEALAQADADAAQVGFVNDLRSGMDQTSAPLSIDDLPLDAISRGLTSALAADNARLLIEERMPATLKATIQSEVIGNHGARKWTLQSTGRPDQRTGGNIEWVDSLNRLETIVVMDRVSDAISQLSAWNEQKRKVAKDEVATYTGKGLSEDPVDHLIFLTTLEERISAVTKSGAGPKPGDLTKDGWFSEIRDSKFSYSRPRSDDTLGSFEKFPDLLDGKFGLTLKDLPDLKRVRELINSKDGMVKYLEPLDVKLEAAVSASRPPQAGNAPGKAPTVEELETQLLLLLREKEQVHGFSSARVIPVGILPGDVFLGLPVLAYVAEDKGAGIEHGELTHRLQWNAIMTRFESDMKEPGPEAWINTPLDLYTRIAERDLHASRFYARTLPPDLRPGSLWSFLLDLPGKAGYAAHGFNRPDDMVQFFLDQTKPGAPDPALTKVAAVVSSQYQRLSDARDRVITAWTELAKVSADQRAGRCRQLQIATEIDCDYLTGKVEVSSIPTLNSSFDVVMHAYGSRIRNGGGFVPMQGMGTSELLIQSGDSESTLESVAQQRAAIRKRFSMPDI